MSLDVKVPSVGESITEVTIASWHKNDGDFVTLDEVLCELESDKATFEFNAPASGILRIVVQEGETIPVGELFCRIEEKNGAPADAPKPQAKEPQPTTTAPVNASAGTTPPAPQKPAAAPKAVEMKVPAVGESITEVTIASWHKNDGDAVKKEEILCEIESDKATFELPAEADGIRVLPWPSAI
jgi:2-oxoglutarate dehydrogenase E2 component (dihydrolipoamide succinyltransferase)